MKANHIQIAKELLSPPGDTIQEHIDFIGMSQAELAERMGRPKEKINEIIKGKEPITTATAFQLEHVLGIPAAFWMKRESTYRCELYALQRREELLNQLDWLKAFPVKEMKQLGWLQDATESQALIEGLLKFFAVASPDEWKRMYVSEEVSVAFRVSLARTTSPHAVSAWLRQGELQARDLILESFDKKKFKEALHEAKEMAFNMPPDFIRRLQTSCAHCGVALVCTPALPKAPISGATRWLNNKPLMQLSGRFKTNDHFWFTFFHEAAHILLHGKKDIFLENIEGTAMDQEKEDEANTFAANALIGEKSWRVLRQHLPLSTDQIEQYAQKLRVHPGIIVGRLQHEKLVPHHFGNRLKSAIDLFAVG